MGPGILTRYTKETICGLLVVLAVSAASLYVWYRNPVGGVSPYEPMDDFFRQEGISFTLEQEVYPADAEEVLATIRNDSADSALAPDEGVWNDWLLEKQVDGVWHSLRLQNGRDHVRWAFPAEFSNPDSIPSGAVLWGGGEQTYLCRIADYYRFPLEDGRYRIVFPAVEYGRRTGAMSAEFEVK